MKIMHHHDHHCRYDPQVEDRLRRMECQLDLIIANQEILMSHMDDLRAAVARNTSAKDSVVTLLKGISQQLKDAAGDPAAVAEVVAQLDANTTALSQAAVENTPAA